MLVANPAVESRSTPLSESERKNWHHLDLLQDTVPGMSVERAYTDIIKKKKGNL